MALGVDGLISGLDTTTLINNLIKADSVPQILLKQKSAGIQGLTSAYQTLNSTIASLTEKAKAAAKADSFQLFTAKASADGLSAVATKGAQPGQLDITVDKLAQGQVSVSAGMTAWSGGATFSIKTGTETTEITAASDSLDDIVSAINSSDTGVKAVKVAAGKDAGGVDRYRIQFSSTTTGADSAFEVLVDDAGGTAQNLLSAAGAAEIRKAQDASVKLWAGTGAEQVITSSTNKFEGLLPGVDVTVSKASADPVTLTVARDDAGISAIAKGLVDSLNNVFSYISSNSAISTETDPATGNTVVKGGRFTANTTVASVKQSLLSAATMPVDGRSPSEIGISITRDGTVEFDAAKFTEAIAADPARVEATLQEISQRVSDAGTHASDKYDGLLTKLIESQESQVKDLGKRISDWDQRLEDRRASLTRQYAALEVQLGALNSQSTWLSGQIAGLPKGSS